MNVCKECSVRTVLALAFCLFILYPSVVVLLWFWTKGIYEVFKFITGA